RMHHTGGPRVDHAEALAPLAAGGDRSRGFLQRVPGGRRLGDARLLEQRLVVVQRIDVDLVGNTVDGAVDAGGRGNAGRPCGADVTGNRLGRLLDEAVTRQFGQPQIVDAG